MERHKSIVAEIYDPEFELGYVIMQTFLGIATDDDIREGIDIIRKYRQWITDETLDTLVRFSLMQIFEDMEFNDPLLTEAINELLELVGIPDGIDLSPDGSRSGGGPY